MKRLFIFLTILVLLIVGVFYVISTNQNRQIDDPLPNPLHKLSYAGSLGIGEATVEIGIASLKENYQNLDEVSLYWYNLDTDNQITLDESVSEETENETVAFAKQNGKQVFFGISDHGEAEKADDILTDEDKQNEHISRIISIIEDNGYDGVIIDYEDMRNDQEEDFTSYMRKLSEEVHSKGKILGISAPIETEGKVWHGINAVEVSKLVDRMHLVTYEEFSENTGPGPVASIQWVERIIQNAIDQGVSPDKIILGISFSANYWQVQPEETFSKHTTAKEALEFANNQGIETQWDNEKKGSYFEYDSQENENEKFIVWVEDVNSVKEKIALAKRYKLQGIFFWHLGAVDQKLWEVL
jgi:spore germination protein